MPTEGLALYSDYRPHLINFGWIPKKRSYDGWPKQWREVTCGSRLCSAEFISPDRSEKLFISLWPKVGPGKQTVLYLASQFTLDQDWYRELIGIHGQNPIIYFSCCDRLVPIFSTFRQNIVRDFPGFLCPSTWHWRDWGDISMFPTNWTYEQWRLLKVADISITKSFILNEKIRLSAIVLQPKEKLESGIFDILLNPLFLFRSGCREALPTSKQK